MSELTLEDARRAIDAAERRATELGQPMNIAVVDAGGNLVAHVRMDKAWIGSIDVSIKKAYTSHAFEIERKIWQSTLNPDSSSSAYMRQTMARS